MHRHGEVDKVEQIYYHIYLSIFLHLKKKKKKKKKKKNLSTALVFHCFLEFRRIGEYISLDLFY